MSKYIVWMNIILLCVIYFSWVGYTASDDGLYAQAAENWLKFFPYLGENHWSLRHPLVLSTALSYFIFGVNEYSLVLTTTFYFFIIINVTFFYFRKIFGTNIAFIISLAIICSPLFAIQSTIAGCDFSELLFIILSLFIFNKASEKNEESNKVLFILSGVLAALAWLTRETSAILMIFYSLLFLYGYGNSNRKNYILIATGFLCVAVSEVVIYYFIEGDALYRVLVDIDQGKSTGNLTKNLGTGNVEFNFLLNPFLAILINQEYMLLYFYLIPATYWLFKNKKPQQKNLLVLFFLFGVLWFVIVSYGFRVRALPRYYLVTSYFSIVIIIVWLSELYIEKKRTSIILIVLFFSTNFIGNYVDNKQPIFGERSLYQWLEKNPDKIIYTDPITFYKSEYLLQLNQDKERVIIEEVPKGNGIKYYFYNPNRVLEKNRRLGYSDEYKPSPHWEVIEQIKPGRKWSGILIEWIGLEQFIPRDVVKKLNYAAVDITIYRIN